MKNLLRRTPVGTVRIKEREYIRLLLAASEAERLERERERLEREGERLLAEREARTMLKDAQSAGLRMPECSSALVADLPVHESGALHRAGFALMLESARWAEQEIHDLTSATTGGDA